MAPGARGIKVKVDKNPHDVGRPHVEEGRGDVSLHLRDQKTTPHARPHPTTASDHYKTIVDVKKTDRRDPAQDAKRFDAGKSGMLTFKATDTQTALVTLNASAPKATLWQSAVNAVSGLFYGIGVFFGFGVVRPGGERVVDAVTADLPAETTRVDRGEGSRAAVALSEMPLLDSTTIYRGSNFLSFYSHETADQSVTSWNQNHAKLRLLDLANSPFSDLPIVREAKEAVEALDRLRLDPSDAQAVSRVESWHRRFDANPREITPWDLQNHRAEADWKEANKEITEFRFAIEEPLMTEVPVYWDGIQMSPGLVKLRQSGEVLGVDMLQVNPIDIAAARMDGRTSIPAAEMTVWMQHWGDVSAVENAVIKALPEGFSFSPMESNAGYLISTEGRLVFAMAGSPDLRVVVTVKRAPSVVVDIP